MTLRTSLPLHTLLPALALAAGLAGALQPRLSVPVLDNVELAAQAVANVLIA